MVVALHQFDYVFAIGMIFAFLDAWNIGANDVANSFASSVSSRSLKYWQAMILAALCEFLGAVLVGSRVSDTIRNKIVDVKEFSDEPAALMLTMACALVGSSLWLSFATSIGMPVSTTHSIVGAVIGAAIAAKGGNNIIWGWAGVSQIIASWFIAPLLAGILASIIFLFSKYCVLEVKNPKTSLRNAMLLVPFLVFVTFSILTMLIVWKGSPKLKLNKLSGPTTVAAILGTGAVAFGVYMLFLYPYYRRKLIHGDWTLKWYHIFIGPIYWFKSTSDIPPIPEDHSIVPDYYKGRRYEEEGGHESSEADETKPHDTESGSSIEKGHEQHSNIADVESQKAVVKKEEKVPTKTLWWNLLKAGPKEWPRLLWLVVSHGFVQDVISNQVQHQDLLSGDLKGMHQRSKYYDNKLEFLYSLLQAITASTMSFAHGANDIANATGPLATIYVTWSTNTVGSKNDVPVWVLAYAAAALVIGVWTYGYNIMRNLGNKLILQSPSRGFSIELGAAVTTVMATQLAIPVSTTQSAVGATVFVGLCNRELKSVNWRIVAWCYLGWIFTLPMAGLIAGLLNAIIIHAPRLGQTYSLSS
ncbi:phosphate permease PHO89 [Scheffersomyces amazonensis]|uniref:phosphate permease PHO89 n=1 Tax=Scheffersomyces amazonensis TaxID=1078765 RepID=UPI00315CC669